MAEQPNLRTHLISVFDRIDEDYRSLYYPKIKKFDEEINAKVKSCMKREDKKKCYDKFNVSEFDFSTLLNNFEKCVEKAFPVSDSSVQQIDQCYRGYQEEMKQALTRLY